VNINDYQVKWRLSFEDTAEINMIFIYDSMD